MTDQDTIVFDYLVSLLPYKEELSLPLSAIPQEMWEGDNPLNQILGLCGSPHKAQENASVWVNVITKWDVTLEQWLQSICPIIGKTLLEGFALNVRTLAKPGEEIHKQLTPHKLELWHMGSCIPGEAGELFDAIKKHVVYNKEIDRENVVEELGDLEFYMEGLRSLLEITREETLVANRVKLAKRYGGTYSDAKAQTRKDKA